MVEIGEKYALKPLFDILEAKFASKIEKCGSRPPIVLSSSNERDFQITFFRDFYAYYDENALNIPI